MNIFCSSVHVDLISSVLLCAPEGANVSELYYSNVFGMTLPAGSWIHLCPIKAQVINNVTRRVSHIWGD